MEFIYGVRSFELMNGGDIIIRRPHHSSPLSLASHGREAPCVKAGKGHGVRRQPLVGLDYLPVTFSFFPPNFARFYPAMLQPSTNPMFSLRMEWLAM